MAGCLSRILKRGLQRGIKRAQGYYQVHFFLILGSELILTVFFFSSIMQRLYNFASGTPGGFSAFSVLTFSIQRFWFAGNSNFLSLTLTFHHHHDCYWYWPWYNLLVSILLSLFWPLYYICLLVVLVFSKKIIYESLQMTTKTIKLNLGFNTYYTAAIKC